MPQELRVVRCYKCKMFQADIVKKVKKWACKICGEKQSLYKEFTRGSGKDCRLLVQKLSEKYRQNDIVEEQTMNEVLSKKIVLPEIKPAYDCSQISPSSKNNKWVSRKEDERDLFPTENYNLNIGKRKRDSEIPFVELKPSENSTSKYHKGPPGRMESTPITVSYQTQPKHVKKPEIFSQPLTSFHKMDKKEMKVFKFQSKSLAFSGKIKFDETFDVKEQNSKNSMINCGKKFENLHSNNTRNEFENKLSAFKQDNEEFKAFDDDKILSTLPLNFEADNILRQEQEASRESKIETNSVSTSSNSNSKWDNFVANQADYESEDEDVFNIDI